MMSATMAAGGRSHGGGDMGEVVLVFSVSTLVLFFVIGWDYARDEGLARPRPSFHAFVKGKIGHTKAWAVLAVCRKWINRGPVLLVRWVLRSLRISGELLWDVLFTVAATISNLRTVASRRKSSASQSPRAEPHLIPREGELLPSRPSN
ncbi:MAG TPA: hypothetical protein VFO57_00170 [Burkholderiales bacterium]|nr:hypothetical protein [Burkholderiales bacterium]